MGQLVPQPVGEQFSPCVLWRPYAAVDAQKLDQKVSNGLVCTTPGWLARSKLEKLSPRQLAQLLGHRQAKAALPVAWLGDHRGDVGRSGVDRRASAVDQHLQHVVSADERSGELAWGKRRLHAGGKGGLHAAFGEGQVNDSGAMFP